jgi:pyruvate dehydrogenase E2 component (dihydrolipoamide acetyltransferase)
MPSNIVLPESMANSTLTRWLKAEGELIQHGDILAQIETDKAVMDLQAEQQGVLKKIMISEGTSEVASGTIIAILEDPNEGVPSQPVGQVAAASRIFASPRARRVAAEAGVQLSELNGSGPHGRIIERDIAAALSTRQSIPQIKPNPNEPEVRSELPGSPSVTSAHIEVPHDSMRKTVARRLLESKQTIPHFYISVECVVDRLLALKEQVNEAMKELPEGRKISVNDFIIKAWSLALARVPEANVSWTEHSMLRHQGVDVAVAVAIPGGLVTPIIRCAHAKSLAIISSEMKDLAKRAANRRLKSNEYEGGTTCISNLGMYGVRGFSAIINPPQATILAVGAAERRPVVDNDAIRIATLMECTLSIDHRAIDGAVAAKSLTEFKRIIENPVAMLVIGEAEDA